MERIQERFSNSSAERESRAGPHFELRSPVPPHESLGRWPRAEIEDLERALERARDVLDRGRAAEISRAARAAITRLAREQPQPDGRDLEFAAALGLEASEAQRHQPYDPLALSAWSEPATAPHVHEDAAVVLLVSHWSELHVSFRRRLARLLVAGHAVVVLAPARVPMIAERFARELAGAGLPSGALEVLFMEGQEILWQALERGGFDRLAAAGHRELEQVLAQRLGSGAPTRAAFTGFGAGVVEPAAGVRLAFELLGRSDFHVHADDDPLERAGAAAALALGRSEALSGQLPGQVGRISCHPRRFSAFTAALLAILENSPAFADPLPPFDPDLSRELERVRELGLDEGATLIVEGGPASREDRGWGRLFPLVFTNVEPGMRLARLERPMPVLLLQRELPAGPPPGGIVLPLARVEESGT